MKIVHVVAGNLSGGAAKGAYNIHRALCENGVDSYIITSGRNDTNDPYVISLRETFMDKVRIVLQVISDQITIKKYKNRTKTTLSSGIPFFAIDLSKLEIVQTADIVNLHWINSGMINIKKLKKLRCKIIWTLRDMWPITGICHYTLGCEGYLTGCGCCSQLNSKKRNDISKRVSKIKKQLSSKITTVGVSTWIKNEADRSYIFRDSKNYYIQNCINTLEFLPVEKKEAQKILNLNDNKKIILIGAQNLNDSYKGGKYLKDLLKLIDPSKFQFLILGKSNRELESLLNELKFEYKLLGFLSDPIALRIVYSSANVFLTLSIQDCLPKMPVESMSCKTPVVAFNTTGLIDIVDNYNNGRLVEVGDLESMKEALEWVCFNDKYDTLCNEANLKATTYFDSKVVALKYKKLYEEVLS